MTDRGYEALYRSDPANYLRALAAAEGGGAYVSHLTLIELAALIEELTAEIMKHWRARQIGPSTVCHFCDAFVAREEQPELIPHDVDCIVRKMLTRALIRNVGS